MILVYLDWNIFDKLEKKDSLNEKQRNIYSKIEVLIKDYIIICPYSNAHINDLLRGHANNPNYIPKHLETLKRLTNNLCIILYGGRTQTNLEYRDVVEFFNTALADKEVKTKSFTELFDGDETGLLKMEFKKLTDLLNNLPIPKELKVIFEVNHVFNCLFPSIKKEMNLLSMCNDLIDFSNNARNDNSIYKPLKANINKGIADMKKYEKELKKNNNFPSEVQNYFNFDDIWEKFVPKHKTSDNPNYQKLTNTYFKIDFKGYKSDDRFSNMIDDSLHVFYGAHCSYFITIDERCYYKATETYRELASELAITTKVMKPDEFIDKFTN